LSLPVSSLSTSRWNSALGICLALCSQVALSKRCPCWRASLANSSPFVHPTCFSSFLTSGGSPSLWRGNPVRPAIALTFDDGPSESTPQLLKILARHKVPATFFQCGVNVERLPAVAREVRSEERRVGKE